METLEQMVLGSLLPVLGLSLLLLACSEGGESGVTPDTDAGQDGFSVDVEAEEEPEPGDPTGTDGGDQEPVDTISDTEPGSEPDTTDTSEEPEPIGEWSQQLPANISKEHVFKSVFVINVYPELIILNCNHCGIVELKMG